METQILIDQSRSTGDDAVIKESLKHHLHGKHHHQISGHHLRSPSPFHQHHQITTSISGHLHRSPISCLHRHRS
ncbi:hypothetical protein Hanom_Chr06g00500861 [Helianthus anomalus]